VSGPTKLALDNRWSATVTRTGRWTKSPMPGLVLIAPMNAVSMPTKSPCRSTREPPEFPG
jgi:hypothetical protein